jgi:uncharacterized membrane protein YkvA (DUF1232 family)
VRCYAGLIKGDIMDDFLELLPNIVIVAIAVVWVISPIDLIPDFIPIIGVLDDIAVSIFAIEKLLRIIVVIIPIAIIAIIVMIFKN